MPKQPSEGAVSTSLRQEEAGEDERAEVGGWPAVRDRIQYVLQECSCEKVLSTKVSQCLPHVSCSLLYAFTRTFSSYDIVSKVAYS